MKINKKIYICLSCGYLFDENKGDKKNKIEPNTSFLSLPENWICPDCGASKDSFEEIDFLDEDEKDKK